MGWSYFESTRSGLYKPRGMWLLCIALGLSNLSAAEQSSLYVAQPKLGDALMDMEQKTVAMRSYLAQQGVMMNSLLARGDYRVALELGCHEGYNGRYIQAPYQYIGVDINKAAIVRAQRQERSPAHLFVHSSIENFLSFPIPRSTLVVFPFNLFGNLAGKEQQTAVRLLAHHELDFVLFSYQNHPQVDVEREKYYRQVFGSVKKEEDLCGTRFFNPEYGFSSTSYSRPYYAKLLRELSLQKTYRIEHGRVGELGSYYLFQHTHAKAAEGHASLYNMLLFSLAHRSRL